MRFFFQSFCAISLIMVPYLAGVDPLVKVIDKKTRYLDLDARANRFGHSGSKKKINLVNTFALELATTRTPTTSPTLTTTTTIPSLTSRL